MDSVLCSGQQRKPSRRSHGAKKKKLKPCPLPVKVVYISNPMRVKATASEFRALVQELTGQDSDLPDPTQFFDHVSDGGTFLNNGQVSGGEISFRMENDDPAHENGPALDSLHGRRPEGVVQFGEFDDENDEVFTPQMLENLAELSPSGLLAL